MKERKNVRMKERKNKMEARKMREKVERPKVEIFSSHEWHLVEIPHNH